MNLGKMGYRTAQWPVEQGSYVTLRFFLYLLLSAETAISGRTDRSGSGSR